MRGIPRGRSRVVILVATSLAILLVILLAVGAAFTNGSDDSGARRVESTRPPPSTRPASAPQADPNTTVSVFAPLEMRQLIDQLAAPFSAANPGMSVEAVLGTSDDLLERMQSGEESGVYIDERSVVARLGARRVRGEPIPMGQNQILLVVQRGNPKRIGDLSVFGAQAATVSVICSEEVPCGVLGHEVLEAAGVVAVPDLVHVDGREAVNQVAAGRVDAALLFRSDVHSRLGKVQAIGFAPEQNVFVDYQLVRVGQGAAADAFAQFVQSEQGQLILKRRGFLSLW